MKLDRTYLIEYSEHEFLEILKAFWDGDVTEAEENEFVQRFNKIIEHPEKSDLIFYPPGNRDDSTEGVIDELKGGIENRAKLVSSHEPSMTSVRIEDMIRVGLPSLSRVTLNVLPFLFRVRPWTEKR